jgi:hypothetical protein
MLTVLPEKPPASAAIAQRFSAMAHRCVASNIRLLTKAEIGEPLPVPFYEFTACFLVLQGLQPLVALLILKWRSIVFTTGGSRPW